MSLRIENLNKNGDASEEYLLMVATEDLNLNDYAVVDRTYDADGNVSNVFRHTYRFPAFLVRKGEYVSLRTNKGDYKKGTVNGKPVHRFFWNSDAPVWNDGNAESAEVWKVSTVAKKITGNPAPKKELKLKLRPDNLKYGGK